MINPFEKSFSLEPLNPESSKKTIDNSFDDSARIEQEGLKDLKSPLGKTIGKIAYNLTLRAIQKEDLD